MKLHRTGYYRNRGTSLLISDDLMERCKAKKWGAPSWNKTLGDFDFTVRGRNVGGPQYQYGITLDAQELLAILETAAPDLDPASRAVALGALASLREILVPKDEGQLKKAA